MACVSGRCIEGINMKHGMYTLMGIIALGLSHHALADGFSSALQQLAAKPVVRAQFQQSKTIANSSKPMLSKGSLLFVKNQGVLWQLSSPVKADLIVTPRKMVQKTAHTQSVVNLKQTPYGPAATVLLQLMSGNEAALRQHFQVTQFQQNGNTWNASLQPKSANMKPLFSRVDITGGTYVNKIVLIDPQQRPTNIVFTEQTSANNSLNNSENALFKLAQ